MSNDENNNYIIEYVVVGKSVKISAFDPITLKEATVIGTRNTPKKQLAELAIRKLIYIIEKDENK